MTGDEMAGLEGGEDEIATLSSSLLNDLDRQFLKWRPSYLSSSTTVGLRIVGSYLGNANKIPPLGVPEVAFLGRSNVGTYQKNSAAASVLRARFVSSMPF
jgi:hypothetical protein